MPKRFQDMTDEELRDEVEENKKIPVGVRMKNAKLRTRVAFAEAELAKREGRS